MPESSITPENQDESVEKPFKGGAGAIFYIADADEFMFFLRDEKDWIPFPGKVDIIGGHMDPGESPEQTAMREFGEELVDKDTGEPYQPEEITLFKEWKDDRDVHQYIFGCVLPSRPNVRITEGQGLVFLSRAELPKTDFAFGYNDVVAEYAATVQPSQDNG